MVKPAAAPDTAFGPQRQRSRRRDLLAITILVAALAVPGNAATAARHEVVCRLKDRYTPDRLAISLRKAIEAAPFGYRTEERRISTFAHAFWVTGRGGGTLFGIKAGPDGLVIIEMNRGSVLTPDDEILADPRSANLHEAVPALARRALRDLVTDPSCAAQTLQLEPRPASPGRGRVRNHNPSRLGRHRGRGTPRLPDTTTAFQQANISRAACIE